MNKIRKIWLIFLLSAAVCSGQTIMRSSESKQIEDLITGLSSSDRVVASQSAVALFRQGEGSVSHLVRLKGNKAAYRGYCLGDPNSADIIVDGHDETDEDSGKTVSIEIAGLYLLSAIYYDNLAFASVPYLSGRKNVADFRYNTAKRTGIAWRAIDEWYMNLEKHGLSEMRRRDWSPLKSSDVYFIGTNTSRPKVTKCGE